MGSNLLWIQKMMILLAAATGVLLVTSLAPISRHPHWIIRGMDFPRLQLATFAAAVIVAQFAVLDMGEPSVQVMLGLALACLVWQLWWILPYTPIWPVEVRLASDEAADRNFSIMTANVLTPNRSTDKLIALVHKHRPDILVTLESDQWWQDQLNVLEVDMPHSIKCPLDNLYGMHVYSRLPLLEGTIEFLVEDDVPSMHAMAVLRCGDRIRMHFLHPAPPSPTENPESAERDAELIIVARSIAETNVPTVVTGDLNDVAWSATTRLFRKLSGLLDPRVGRGMFNTFHAGFPFLRWPLDHLFHSEHFTLKSIHRLPSIDSDHFALLTELVYQPAKGADQEGISGDEDDKAWADEIVDEKDVNRGDVPQPEG